MWHDCEVGVIGIGILLRVVMDVANRQLVMSHI